MSRLIVFLLLFFLSPALVSGQESLSLSNAETIVRGVSFRFTESSTFEAERLNQQMATKAPGFFDKWKQKFDFLPFVTAKTFPFEPIELQRDVVRIRNFYHRSGFPHAQIDYPASQFRLADNSIHIILTVAEGLPLTLDSILVQLTAPLYPDLAERWTKLVQSLESRKGQRFTELQGLQMENQVIGLLQDRGYAFAKASSETKSGATENSILISLKVDPGPLTTVDDIIIEGASRVDNKLLLRELPFKKGDRYSRKRFIEGQQELFNLGLFRLALADLPDQPTDSTVDVRYTVRESKPRFVSVETGFSWEAGLSFDSNLRHRNFMGGARQLTAATSINSGWLASPAGEDSPIRSVSTSLSLRQPYVGTTKLSGSTSPFYSWQDDPNLDTRYYKVGLTTGLLYEILPFRTISLQHSFSRTVPLIGTNLGPRFDIYDLNLLSLGGTVGKVNNFLSPRRGFLIRPQIETGGLIGSSEIEFVKGRLDLAVYLPVTKRSSAALMVTIGKLIPTGNSRDQVSAENEFRFDAIRFYSGGSTDVRGWSLNALGPQIALADSIIANTDGSFSVKNARYEAIGGEAKLSARLEFRLPFPGLGSSWSIGTFLDGGVLSSKLVKDASGRSVLTAEGLPNFIDKGALSFGDMKFGTGAGVRYQTPDGLLRLDLAYKLNPSNEDLRTAKDVYLFQSGVTNSLGKERLIRRFNLQLSIERTF